MKFIGPHNSKNERPGPLRQRAPRLFATLLLAALPLAGCRAIPAARHSEFSRFVGIGDFSHFTPSHATNGNLVLLSPPLASPLPWNELIVSWNAGAPAGSFLNIEAAAVSPGTATKFYSLGQWSPDGVAFPRTSVRHQGDANGTVDTDTLVLSHPATAVRLRLTCGGVHGARPRLKFIGLSFSNTNAPPVSAPSGHSLWGKMISTPERSQHGYPGGAGWCSPTALSMALAHWAEVLNRPELDVPVPQAAAAVYDQAFAGTGNWPFNTAFAGSFPGLRAYVTRLDDLSEVESWIAAGVPVILSARWDLLEPGRQPDPDGHLVVCIGFTPAGDVVINDPAARLDRGESVRHIYRRANVLRAWASSRHTVYLIYPENYPVPANSFRQW